MTQSIPQLPETINIVIAVHLPPVGHEAMSITAKISPELLAKGAAEYAALAAQPLVGVIPEGMALVPIVPTGVMKDCGASALPVSAAHTWIAADVWRAMLAAAKGR